MNYSLASSIKNKTTLCRLALAGFNMEILKGQSIACILIASFIKGCVVGSLYCQHLCDLTVMLH